MIRILHVVSTIGVSSGVMSFIMSYYRNINRESIQFDFVYWLDGNVTYAEEIKKLGGRVYIIPKPGLTKEYKSNIENFFKKNSSEYKILHLHEVYLNNFIPPIARRYGIEHIIAHSHTTRFSDKKINALRNRLLCFPLKRNVNRYFACSVAAGKFLYGEKYFQLGKVKVINNAIDCEKFRYNKETRVKMRKLLGINDKFVMGHVGRFNSQKNHDFLIKVFIEVLKKEPKSILMLIGIGPLEQKIIQKVELENLKDKVLFLGQRNDVQDLFQAMDTFVLPSLYEGLGIVLIEAQATGLSCYTSNVVPVEAKITEKLRFISLKASFKEWAKLILEDNNSEERVNEVEKVKRAGFDIKKEAKILESIYLSFL